MAAKRPPSLPAGRAASPAEVRSAIEALTVADYGRLHKFGRAKVRSLGERAGGLTAEDLLSEAVVRSLSRTRRWDPTKVDLPGFLMGVIRSMVSHLRRGEPGSTKLPLMEADLGTDEDPAPMDRQARTKVTPERQAIAKDLLQTLDQQFAQDAEAALVVGAWRDNMTGREIKEALGWSQVQLETVTRRIRRNARFFSEGGRNVQ